MCLDSDLHYSIFISSIRVFSVLSILAGIMIFIFRTQVLKVRWITVLLATISLGSLFWYYHCKSNYLNEGRLFYDRLKEAFFDSSYKHIIYFDESDLQKHNCALSISDYDQIKNCIFNCEYTVMNPRLAIEAADPIKLYFHDYEEIWLTVYKYSLMEIHYRGSRVVLSGNRELYELIRAACVMHIDGRKVE